MWHFQVWALMWWMNLWPHICNSWSQIHIWSGIYKLHLCIPYATKWRHWGMFIHGKTNFAFPPTLCKLDCNRCSYLRDSDTSAIPRTWSWIASIGAPCQMLVERKNLVGRRKRIKKYNGITTAFYAFPLRALQVVLRYVVCHRFTTLAEAR